MEGMITWFFFLSSFLCWPFSRSLPYVAIQLFNSRAWIWNPNICHFPVVWSPSFSVTNSDCLNRLSEVKTISILNLIIMHSVKWGWLVFHWNDKLDGEMIEVWWYTDVVDVCGLKAEAERWARQHSSGSEADLWRLHYRDEGTGLFLTFCSRPGPCWTDGCWQWLAAVWVAVDCRDSWAHFTPHRCVWNVRGVGALDVWPPLWDQQKFIIFKWWEGRLVGMSVSGW